MKLFSLMALLVMNSLMAFSSVHTIDDIRKKYQLAVYDSKVANALSDKLSKIDNPDAAITHPILPSDNKPTIVSRDENGKRSQITFDLNNRSIFFSSPQLEHPTTLPLADSTENLSAALSISACEDFSDSLAANQT